MIALDSLLSGHLCGRARLDLDLVAVGEIDRRIEDHLIAVLDAGAHLDGRTEVAAPQLSSGAIRIVDILKADAKRIKAGTCACALAINAIAPDTSAQYFVKLLRMGLAT
jgi:hypothetical protein